MIDILTDTETFDTITR